jgi:hypothetical protein
MRIILTGFVIVSLCACATIPDSSVDYPHNPIETSSRLKATILLASAPDSLCHFLNTATFRVNKVVVADGKEVRTWISGISLNGGMFKSDDPTRRIFAQAFTLEPGDYELELRYTGEGLAFGGGRYPDKPLRPLIRVSAGELKYVGTVMTKGCGSIQWKIVDDWLAVRPVFSRVYPELPMESVQSAVPDLRPVNPP